MYIDQENYWGSSVQIFQKKTAIRNLKRKKIKIDKSLMKPTCSMMHEHTIKKTLVFVRAKDWQKLLILRLLKRKIASKMDVDFKLLQRQIDDSLIKAIYCFFYLKWPVEIVSFRLNMKLEQVRKYVKEFKKCLKQTWNT